jgi:hypothetical protein
MNPAPDERRQHWVHSTLYSFEMKKLRTIARSWCSRLVQSQEKISKYRAGDTLSRVPMNQTDLPLTERDVFRVLTKVTTPVKPIGITKEAGQPVSDVEKTCVEVKPNRDFHSYNS